MKKMIYIASDHAGFELKEKIKNFLKNEGYKFEDLGPYEYNPNDDYPDYALKACLRALKAKGRGILICSTGLGMNMVANKIPGIYAAVCWNGKVAKQAREHLNTNVLTLGARAIKLKNTKRIVKTWLETPFSSQIRYLRRINKIKKIERKFKRELYGLFPNTLPKIKKEK